MFETIGEWVDQGLKFVEANHDWAPPFLFLFAFGESVAVISLIFPATVVLVGIGGLVGAGTLDFWPLWFAATIGAGLGNWFSYWLGARFGLGVFRFWPLRNYPDLEPRGERFLKRYGFTGVFLGQFLGPMRASVPLVCGIFRMDALRYQAASWAACAVWTATLLAPGAFAVSWFS
ncbi:MAG TPA: DedA family protein [Micropepsaceae bacterium]|nr:DedA family protein [Micropepsaceae bacterium]